MFGAVGQGINRSTDGGASFQPVNTGIDGVVVHDFAQNPRDLELYFINSGSGLGRTFDGGQNWDFPICPPSPTPSPLWWKAWPLIPTTPGTSGLA